MRRCIDFAGQELGSTPGWGFILQSVVLGKKNTFLLNKLAKIDTF
jgi:hypothetical protein